jgi:hypothetical protein
MTKSIRIVPAYGRDYTTLAALKEDYDANKDFIIRDVSNRWDGKPCNKSDIEAQGITEVWVRFDKLTEQRQLL